MGKEVKFSVLMSIYKKEKPEYFNRSMTSIWDEQEIKPNEIVLVHDGPLPSELSNVIQEWENKLKRTLVVVPLSKNIGLGNALNIGLKYCSYEVVARMDTDDISFPSRFKKQLEVFCKKNSIDVCGSWVTEFDLNEADIQFTRKLPEYHDDILTFSKKRSPINHPAVMFKKSAVILAGNYKHMLWTEDYYLWARMLLNKSVFYNIQEPLVNMRAGSSQLERRGGIKYLKSEFVLQKEFLDIGFINRFEYNRNLALRMFVRLLPKKILKQVYKKLRE